METKSEENPDSKSRIQINSEHADIIKTKQQKSIKYLLSQSLQFSNFFKQKLEGNLNLSVNKDSKDTKCNEEVLIGKYFDGNGSPLYLTLTNLLDHLDIMKKLKFFSGTLKTYQIEGLAWLKVLFENGVSGILADEMGLGKTIQVIALICHLYEMKVDGPYLIIVPLSTISNWVLEFQRFAPKIPVIQFYGNEEQRKQLQIAVRTKYKLDGKMVKPVIITTYQMPMVVKHFFKYEIYQYLIVDEAHCLKNHESQLRCELQCLKASNKLLLTGTPLQNNMTELWSLLNFILPHIFKDMETFSSFILMEDIEGNKMESVNLISMLHQVLAPFMLRRMKSDVLLDMVPKKEVLVYCPLSQLQLNLYKLIIEKNISKLKNPNGNEEEVTSTKRRKCTMNSKSYLNNTELNDENFVSNELEDKVSSEEPESNTAPFICRLKFQKITTMLQHTVNHPYLIHFPLDPNSSEKMLLVDEQLVKSSGKFLVLEAMLSKLHATNHKVLLFTTSVMTLHLIEEFLIMREYEYRKLDGSFRLDSRHASIVEFNNDPEVFLFLCSTRAGGLGINLTAADTVIFFDRYWNPQVDIQAQDRCHRIGQTKPVMVFSLVAKNTIDDHIIQCANAKRKLEKIVIKDGKFKNIVPKKMGLDFDLEELQTILEASDNIQKIQSNDVVFTDEELNVLLDRTELYEEMRKD